MRAQRTRPGWNIWTGADLGRPVPRPFRRRRGMVGGGGGRGYRPVDERHGDFVATLGDRLIGKYTDGGPGRRRNRARARIAKQARKVNR